MGVTVELRDFRTGEVAGLSLCAEAVVGAADFPEGAEAHVVARLKDAEEGQPEGNAYPTGVPGVYKLTLRLRPKAAFSEAALARVNARFLHEMRHVAQAETYGNPTNSLQMYAWVVDADEYGRRAKDDPSVHGLRPAVGLDEMPPMVTTEEVQ